MPKPNISEAPSWIQERYERAGADTSITNLDGSLQTVAAVRHERMMNIAFNAGYDTDPPPMPCTDRLAELSIADPAECARYRRRSALERAQEHRNMIRWQSMRRWASEPSAAELAEQAKAEREKQELAARVDERAAEIVATAERQKRDAALAKARAAAAKELGDQQS